MCETNFGPECNWLSRGARCGFVSFPDDPQGGSGVAGWRGCDKLLTGSGVDSMSAAVEVVFASFFLGFG